MQSFYQGNAGATWYREVPQEIVGWVSGKRPLERPPATELDAGASGLQGRPLGLQGTTGRGSKQTLETAAKTLLKMPPSQTKVPGFRASATAPSCSRPPWWTAVG